MQAGGIRPWVVDTANKILTYLALNEDVLANQESAAAREAGIHAEELARAKKLVTRWSLEDSRLDVLEQRVIEYYQRDGWKQGYVDPETVLPLEELRRREKAHYHGRVP